MVGESTGISIQDLIMRGAINNSSGDGGGDSGSGGFFRFLPDANICWWSIAGSAPGGLGEITHSYAVGFGKPRGFAKRFMEIFQSLGDGFLKNVTTGVSSSSFAELGHLKSGFDAPSGSGSGISV